MAEAVETAGQSAKTAGLSFEQLSAVVAKTMEQTRSEGSQIGNSLKTIFTRISKASKLAGDEVDNATLSNASKALNEIGIAVYETSGEYREFDTIMTELAEKWDGLTDAQQSNLSYQIAATRQSNVLKAILQNWTSSMELATEATNTSGNALENQEKYFDSYGGKLQQISTQTDAFWMSFYNSGVTKGALDVIIGITKGINKMSDSIGAGTTMAIGLVTALTGLSAVKTIKNGGGRDKKFSLEEYATEQVNREVYEFNIKCI